MLGAATPPAAVKSPTRLLVPTVFAVLVLATLGAFVHAQRLKHIGLLLDRIIATRDFSPNGDGVKDLAYIRFRLTNPDHADVFVINDKGQIVRTLDTNAELGSYHYWVYLWDGKTDSDVPLPAGDYRIRVVLHDQHRNLILRKKITIHSPKPAPPRGHG
jgi:hypothetical protein